MKNTSWLLTILLLLLSGISPIAYTNSSRQNFSGMLIGADVSINGAVNDTKYIEPSDKDGPFYFTTSHINYALSAHIGDSLQYRQYRFIPEIFATYAPEKTLTITENNKYYFNQLQTHLTWGLRAEFARMLSLKTSLGLLAALQTSQFNFNLTNKTGNPIDHFRRWKWGWMIGVGSEIKVARSLSLTLKAMYVNYGTMVSHGTEHTTIKAKPTNMIGLIGINYYF